MIEPFNASLPADPAVLFKFRRSLRGWLETAQLGSGAEDALVLAVHEAVANGIEHGSGSPVCVEGSAKDGFVVVEVTTEGSWVTTEGSWEPGSDGHGAFAERGRGLALMRGLTGEFQLLVDAGRVTIRLRPAEVR